jgi:hypothetical protein
MFRLQCIVDSSQIQGWKPSIRNCSWFGESGMNLKTDVKPAVSSTFLALDSCKSLIGPPGTESALDCDNAFLAAVSAGPQALGR